MEMINWKKKGNNTTLIKENEGVVWIEFKEFTDNNYPVKAVYSTRLGGVSTGVCASMNLRNCELDSRQNYETNMHLFFDATGLCFNRIVASHQTHTNNVHIVTEKDIPTGTLFGREFHDIDGLVTNIKNVPLVCSFADCIPLYFYAEDINAAGISHGGWRGCVGDIAGNTVRALMSLGAKPDNIHAAIGPGICVDCYEVSTDVYDAFREHFSDEEMKEAFKPAKPGHYMLDLWMANKIFMLHAGIREENITVTDICTKCNSDYLFSHRVMGFNRGNQIGVIELV